MLVYLIRSYLIGLFSLEGNTIIHSNTYINAYAPMFLLESHPLLVVGLGLLVIWVGLHFQY